MLKKATTDGVTDTDSHVREVAWFASKFGLAIYSRESGEESFKLIRARKKTDPNEKRE